MSSTSQLVKLIKAHDYVATLFSLATNRSGSKEELIVFNSVLIVLTTFNHEQFLAVIKVMKTLTMLRQTPDNIEASCDQFADSYTLSLKKEITGFGSNSKQYPEVNAVFNLARKHHLPIDNLNLIKQLEHSLQTKVSEELVINLVGAVASVLSALTVDVATLHQLLLVGLN